eukprot:2825746-Rhodomonas_salina.1
MQGLQRRTLPHQRTGHRFTALATHTSLSVPHHTHILPISNTDPSPRQQTQSNPTPITLTKGGDGGRRGRSEGGGE